MTNIKNKNLILASLFIALGIALPLAFHMVPNGGKVFLPMHIPIYLCAFLCGWKYGLACAILTPILSSTLTGMPVGAMLPSMIIELSTYALVSAILNHKNIFKNRSIGIYSSLIPAMLTGRIIGGIFNAFIFNMPNYSFNAFISGYFIMGLPGIILQLVILPPMIILLEKLYYKTISQ